MSIFWDVAIPTIGIQLLLLAYACYRFSFVREVLGAIVGILVTFGLWVWLMAFTGPLGAVAMIVYYGMLTHAFFHYRHLRREELRYVLGGATQAQVPLGRAVRAYAEDQPHGLGRHLWEWTTLNAVFLG